MTTSRVFVHLVAMVTTVRAIDLAGWKAFAISGRIDAFADRQVIQSIQEAVSETDRVALDLSGTDFLSLPMLTFLTQLNQKLGQKGGRLALLHPSHNVRRQIEIFIGLRVLEIFGTQMELQASLKNRSVASAPAPAWKTPSLPS